MYNQFFEADTGNNPDGVITETQTKTLEQVQTELKAEQEKYSNLQKALSQERSTSQPIKQDYERIMTEGKFVFENPTVENLAKFFHVDENTMRQKLGPTLSKKVDEFAESGEDEIVDPAIKKLMNKVDEISNTAQKAIERADRLEAEQKKSNQRREQDTFNKTINDAMKEHFSDYPKERQKLIYLDLIVETGANGIEKAIEIVKNDVKNFKSLAQKEITKTAAEIAAKTETPPSGVKSRSETEKPKHKTMKDLEREADEKWDKIIKEVEKASVSP
ncbi:MAG: hypothetical protein KKH98_04320 [Spirochaetes bacterium]|nr:hypothetical protein [Spirochaetota bacterium]